MGIFGLITILIMLTFSDEHGHKQNGLQFISNAEPSRLPGFRGSFIHEASKDLNFTKLETEVNQ